jgi:hypothetical protein
MTSRTDLVPHVIPVRRWWGVLFFAIGAGGIAVVGNSTDLFRWPGILGTIFGGLFVFCGIMQVLRPMRFAVFSEQGVTFSSFRVPLIRWEEILEVRSGPLEVEIGPSGAPQPNPPGRVNLLVMFRPPVVLRIRADTASMETRLAWRHTDVVRLKDGSYELMIDTSQCPVPTEEVVARIEACLDSPMAAPKIFERAFVEARGDRGLLVWSSAFLLIAGGGMIGGLGIKAVRASGDQQAWIAIGLGAVVVGWGLVVFRSRLTRRR